MTTHWTPPNARQTAPGVWEIPASARVLPDAPEVAADYADRLDSICRNDRPHYDRLAAFLRRACPELFGLDSVVAFGGGLPKLESYLACRRIDVVDSLAHTWRRGEAAFERHYPFHPAIKWYPFEFDPDYIRAGGGNLATFVHVLEHLPAAFAADCLAAACRTFPLVMVYGPCIEAARDAAWVHAGIPDHCTYHTLAAMERAIVEAGGTLAISAAWSDDLLVVARGVAR